MQRGTQETFLSIELIMNVSLNSFFPATIKVWNMLESDIKGSGILKGAVPRD